MPFCLVEVMRVSLGRRHGGISIFQNYRVQKSRLQRSAHTVTITPLRLWQVSLSHMVQWNTNPNWASRQIHTPAESCGNLLLPSRRHPQIITVYGVLATLTAPSASPKTSIPSADPVICAANKSADSSKPRPQVTTANRSIVLAPMPLPCRPPLVASNLKASFDLPDKPPPLFC